MDNPTYLENPCRIQEKGNLTHQWESGSSNIALSVGPNYRLRLKGQTLLECVPKYQSVELICQHFFEKHQNLEMIFKYCLTRSTERPKSALALSAKRGTGLGTQLEATKIHTVRNFESVDIHEPGQYSHF